MIFGSTKQRQSSGRGENVHYEDTKVHTIIEEEAKEEFSEDRSEESTLVRIEREKKEVFWEFVIDGTYSFSKIFVPIYSALEHMFKELDRILGKRSGLNLHYGLTVFREGERVEIVRFGDQYFTTNYEDMLTKIRNIEFRGGSADGYENLTGGIEAGLKVLGENTREHNGRCLVFITDSTVRPAEAFVDFGELDIPNNRQRFVLGYHSEEEPDLYFNIVDGEGEAIHGGTNRVALKNIDELLTRERNEGITQIVNSFNDVLSVMQVQ